jgi:tRNA A-37 threonylcarbamoyl transferase component Bud32
LRSLLVGFSELLRLKFKASTGRNIIKFHEYIVKTYNGANESAYECSVLSNIALSKPITFRVPRVFKLLKTQSHSALIMEHIAGHRLDNYILDFLLCSNSDAVKIFYRLGKAVKELHNMGLDGLRSSPLPSSCSELKDEVVELSKRLVTWRLIDHKLFNAILNSLEKAGLTDETFLSVSLHGEFYFTHILVQEGKFILLDFHNAQRGPSYFDLAMLSVSLYVSLAFSFRTLKHFTPLIEAFLTGYYGKGLNAEIIRSMKLAELYVVLREILMYAKALCIEDSLITNLLNTLKIRKLKVAIKELILPKLTA